MTQEEKQLLLKDLCSRLPYGVKLDNGLKLRSIDTLTQIVSCTGSDKKIDCVKPYLRPMSSMTEEEEIEFKRISHCFLKTIVLKRDRKFRVVEQKVYFDNEIPSSGAFGDSGDYRYIEQKYFVNLIDWLNAHHFDYRGLIEKCLALEAPEGMYKTE